MLIGLFINCNNIPEYDIVFEIKLSDNGKEFISGINRYFSLALEECVGCAFDWSIKEMDSSVIKLTDKQSRDKSCKNCVGGYLTRVFIFESIAKGESKLKLGYFNDTLEVLIKVE